MQPVVKAYPNRVSWVLAGNALSDKYFLWLVVALLGLSAKIACAATITYSATLDGASESPSNASPGTGTATVTFDTVLHTMSVQSNFSGLLGTVTAAHIHCCTATPGVGLAGVATTTPTFTGFPLGVTAGTYDHLFDLMLASSWNAPFVTNNGGTPASAESVFLSGIASGEAYFNIHTAQFLGGKIRGFLARAQVPEPATLTLIAISLLGFGALRRGKPA